MNIVSIFGGKLYAFRYKGQKADEYRRLMKLWRDPVYVVDFLEQHAADLPGHKSLEDLALQIGENADAIDSTIREKTKDENNNLGAFFKALHNQEYQVRILSLQKGREQYLRLYAIKISDNCFIVTGGAIKFTHLMEDRDHTRAELARLKQCRDFLNDNGVFDKDSFFELITEQNNDQ
jgi:hypothetical protein